MRAWPRLAMHRAAATTRPRRPAFSHREAMSRVCLGTVARRDPGRGTRHTATLDGDQACWQQLIRCEEPSQVAKARGLPAIREHLGQPLGGSSTEARAMATVDVTNDRAFVQEER